MNDFCESVKRYLIKLCPKHSQNDQYAMRNETHSLWGGGGGGGKTKKKKKKQTNKQKHFKIELT